jgi:hypothetical protein
MFMTAHRWVYGASNQILEHDILLYRIDISAEQLQTNGANVAPVIEGDPRLVPLAYCPVPVGGPYPQLGLFALAAAPSGRQFVLSFRSTSSGPDDLWRLDATNGPVLFQDASLRIFVQEGSWIPQRAKWTPPGVASPRIVFQSGGIIRTMNPDGTGIKTLVTSGGGAPCWSLDGQHIVYSQTTYKTDPWQTIRRTDMFRMPAAGGTAVNLTSELDPLFFKVPMAWTP